MRYLYATFFIMIGVILILLVRSCEGYTDDVPQTRIITIHDTVTIQSPTLVETRYIEIPQKVDTDSIIRAFYEAKVYIDTVRPNQYVTVVVHDTVLRNVLVGQRLDIDTKNLPTVRSRCLAVGSQQGYNLCNVNVEYRWNSRWAASAGYDFCQRTPLVGIKYKLLEW